MLYQVALEKSADCQRPNGTFIIKHLWYIQVHQLLHGNLMVHFILTKTILGHINKKVALSEILIQPEILLMFVRYDKESPDSVYSGDSGMTRKLKKRLKENTTRGLRFIHMFYSHAYLIVFKS